MVSFLQAHGVKGARMRAEGYADTKPVGDNSTADGRTQNRRVQINIAANEELRKKDEEVGNAKPASN